VYVRQSTPQQVAENRKSLARQYALADHAISLGWSTERVLVIDEDLGPSGRTADIRLGFQRLLADVSMDHVCLVLGLEMSRLSRSCKDWHHLLEVCAILGALLADQDGIYDPSDPDGRLLLGLKGQISELEQTVLRIDWIGGTSIEHALRRPISRYVRLCNFPRMRSLVVAGAAAAQKAEEIADCLNREGFRPPSCHGDRFTPELTRELVYRLGLSPRRRPAELLSVDE
jgi:resolvase-like protein